MIDEKKLMKVIEVMVKPLTTPDGCGRFDSEIQAYNEGLIDAMEKVNEQPKVGEWIPCSERLPELGEHVLCMCRADIQEVMCLTPDGWFHDTCHCYMEGFVIAWMPLPEPYKESE